ncbi:MAG: hypothetical protein CM15mP126_7230 [Gammaproteobacteria bacterium]|nr:MAG: hypothetical protein CM15mP126_7230 [Gammaproteobacteria bacterium]
MIHKAQSLWCPLLSTCQNYRNEIQTNNNTVSEETLLSAMADTKSYLIDNFGTINITLGDFQKLVRGDKEFLFGVFQML